jgi:hypothetical protein
VDTRRQSRRGARSGARAGTRAGAKYWPPAGVSTPEPEPRGGAAQRRDHVCAYLHASGPRALGSRGVPEGKMTLALPDVV